MLLKVCVDSFVVKRKYNFSFFFFKKKQTILSLLTWLLISLRILFINLFICNLLLFFIISGLTNSPNPQNIQVDIYSYIAVSYIDIWHFLSFCLKITQLINWNVKCSIDCLFSWSTDWFRSKSEFEHGFPGSTVNLYIVGWYRLQQRCYRIEVDERELLKCI